MGRAAMTRVTRAYRHWLLTIPLFAGLGCVAVSTAQYDVGLFRVERLPTSVAHAGAVTMTSGSDNGRSRVVVEDSLIHVAWSITPARIAFTLTNKSSRALKIVWDDAAFMDPAGVSHRVIHRGIRYEDLQLPQRPTSVREGGKVSDIVLPTHLIFYRSDRGWLERPILSPYRTASPDELAAARANVSQTFGVLLPLDTADGVRHYLFTFRVNDVVLPDNGQ